MIKKLLSAFIFFGCMMLYAANPKPQIVIDAKVDGVKLTTLRGSKNTKVQYGGDNSPCRILGSGSEAADDYQNHSFSFIPESDGTAILTLRNTFYDKKSVHWTEIADLQVHGAEIKNGNFAEIDGGMFPHWYMVDRIQVCRKKTHNAIAVSMAYGASQAIELRAGRKVTVSFRAANGKKTAPLKVNMFTQGLEYDPGYYRYYNRKESVLLPLRNKGVGMKILNGGSRQPEFFAAPEAKFIKPVADKSSNSAKRTIPVELLEESGVERLARVRFGLPFAKGEFFDLRNVRVVDGAGKEIPAQFSAQAFYPDKSIRGALIDCSVYLKRGERKNIFVETGSGVVRDVYPEVMSFSETDDRITVDTGKLQAVINKKSFNLLEDIRVDGKAVGAFSPKGLALYDEHGRLHASSALPLTKVTVEENGVNRLVFKLQGYYGKNKFASFTARIGFRPNSAKVDFALRFINSNIADEFSDYSRLELEFIPSGAVAGKLAMDDKFSAKRIVQWTDKILERDGKKSELRMNGFGSFATADGKISFALKDTWQRYPKGFSVTDKSVKFELLPKQPDAKFGTDLPHYLLFPFCEGFYRSKRGMAFTEDLTIDFSGESPAAELGALDVVAVVDRDYVASTGAWQGVIPHSCTAFDEWDKKAQEAFYRHMEFKDQQREYGFFNYGDWYGERGYNWTNNEYDMAYGLFTLFFRTGNRDLFRWAQIAARHQADVDILQCAPKPEWVGNNFPHSIGHTGHGNRGRNTWSFPFGGNGLNGHTWNGGMIANWILTGDAASIESALLLGEHLVRYAAPKLKKLGTHEREGAWCSIALLNLYLNTGDKRYLDASTRIIKLYLEKQNFQKGGAWPHALPLDHAGGHKETYGNANYLIGILIVSLYQYYQINPSPELEKSIIAAAMWLKRNFDSLRIGWSYTASWDNKPYQPRATTSLNYQVAPAMMIGALLANDRECFEICRQVICLTNGKGFNKIGKQLSHDLIFTPLLLDAMYKFSIRNKVELVIPDATNLLFKDNPGMFNQATPALKKFHVILTADKCTLKIERAPYYAKSPLTDYSITTIASNGKRTDVVSGKHENNSVIAHEFDIKGKAGDVFIINVIDKVNGKWNVTQCSNGKVFNRLSEGYSFVSDRFSRHYISIPPKCSGFSIKFTNPPEEVLIFDENGEKVDSSRPDAFADFNLPWRAGRKAVDAGQGSVVKVKFPASDKKRIWELQMYGNGLIGVGFDGIPNIWSMKKLYYDK